MFSLLGDSRDKWLRKASGRVVGPSRRARDTVAVESVVCVRVSLSVHRLGTRTLWAVKRPRRWVPLALPSWGLGPGAESAASSLVIEQSSRKCSNSCEPEPRGARTSFPEDVAFKVVLKDVREANRLRKKGTDPLVANMARKVVSPSVEKEN